MKRPLCDLPNVSNASLKTSLQVWKQLSLLLHTQYRKQLSWCFISQFELWYWGGGKK